MKVRGYHAGVFGHVNHGRLVELLEEARWAFFDDHHEVEARLHARGLAHAVVRLEVDYHAGARVGDVLRIETGIADVGRSSAIMSQRVRRTGDDTPIADARITNVFLERASGRPAPVRDELLPLRRDSP